MRIIRKTCNWANRGVWHFIAVIGFGGYGLLLGTALAFYLIGYGHLPVGLALGVAYSLSVGCGLISAAGVWYVSIRGQKKAVHE